MMTACSVQRKLTVHGVTERGAAMNDVTDGVTDKPGRPVVENVYVSLVEPTLVAERATVCEPARSLYSFWTLRNASQSFRLLSNTRPGSTALFGSTWPAPQLNAS